MLLLLLRLLHLPPPITLRRRGFLSFLTSGLSASNSVHLVNSSSISTPNLDGDAKQGSIVDRSPKPKLLRSVTPQIVFSYAVGLSFVISLKNRIHQLEIIHYKLPNDPETFVHRSGRTGHAGKDGTAIIIFSSSQRRTVTTLERDVGCRFEHVSAPSVEEVLESSAHQVVSTLAGVHPESLSFFTPMAEKLIEEQGTNALVAALAQLSGFAQPPSARSHITHEQGRVILQLIRDSGATRGFLSARSVMGFLSDVYRSVADEVGKILLIADERVQGAVFNLPEEIAKEVLTMQLPPGNSISKIKKLPALQDDGPPSDFYSSLRET